VGKGNGGEGRRVPHGEKVQEEGDGLESGGRSMTCRSCGVRVKIQMLGKGGNREKQPGR
jgi:hypothetical protein